MHDDAQLSLRYFGGEADQGQMGYYDAASSIIAFGDLMGVFSQTLYGEKAYIQTTVKGVREGSFGIDFILHVGGMLATVLAGPASPRDIWQLFKQCVEAWRFLDGKPPKEIVRNGDQFGITNVQGEVRYFNQNVFLVLNNDKAAEAIEQVVKRPLETGRSRLELENKELSDRVTVTDKEAHAFTNISTEKIITEQTIDQALTIESAVFVEDNKWRFFDGQTSYNAAMEDKAFVDRVNAGERFGKGDILVVELYIVQTERKGRLNTERIVKKVKEHRVRGEQTTLFP